jgi:hypothetical protein
MFGAVMAAQAGSTQLLTKESNQEKEVTPSGTTAIPALPAHDVHKLRQIESNGRGLLQVLIMARERQRIAYSHRAFAALKKHTQDSIIKEMSTRSGVYKNATNYANMEGNGYVLVLHSIPQLAAVCSDIDMGGPHGEQIGTGLLTRVHSIISKDIQFNKHGNTIVPAHVQSLISNEQESKAHTPTGAHVTSRGRRSMARRRLREEKQAVSTQPWRSCRHRTRMSTRTLTRIDRQLPATTWTLTEDQPPGTVKKVLSGNGLSLNELLALEAADGQGNKEEEEGEGSVDSDYVQIEGEDIFSETTLQLPPKCHLHPVGTLRIQGKADWALPLAEAIMKAASAFHANNKIAPRLRSAVANLWNKAPVRKELTEKMEAMIVKWDEEASTKGKHKSRRLSMEQYAVCTRGMG